MKISTILSATIAGVLSLSAAPAVLADDKELIEANTERALKLLKKSDKKSAKLLDHAAGVLVFPDIVKIAFHCANNDGASIFCRLRDELVFKMVQSSGHG